MAYYAPCSCAAALSASPTHESHLAFQPLNPRPKLAPKRIPPSASTFKLRFNGTVKFERRLRLFCSNPSSGDSITEKSGDTAQGPPFPTILAGFLVFFLICWMLGSIIMWLIGVIVKFPPK
ncbi:PREDICTED: uncharacterized protein LOC18614683 [Theobroma cacao]|uniref:Uncharacterized protein LOC18614683 n=1 Tax=Theobroma cacao TaxID=3641 RepID=A0AB32VTG8_THECC|nr:PREDICTED: uncharacterized protein LOC18614683 [Theobroma cacao]